MREGFKNNEKFRGLIENISDGILAIDKDWSIVYVNKTAGKLLKKEPGSLIEKNIWEEFPESIGNKFYKAYHNAMKTQQRVFVEEYSPTLEKWTRAAVYPSPKGLTVYFHDITNERKAELKAKKNEENYRLFIERITDGFIVLDKNFSYVYANRKIGELVRRPVESLIGKNIWEEFPEAVNSLTYKAFQTAMKEQRFISNIDYYEPLHLWQENYIYPSPDGLSVFIRDISDRKLLEKELRDKERNQQFEIMVTALEAQERERTHIGQELHDNVNQLLVSTKLMLALLRDDPKKISREMLNSCIENLEKAIHENRRISHELVTPDIRQEGLAEQLAFLLKTMMNSNGIKARLEISDFNESELDETRKLAVYRIAQEQCSNILKHAKAKNVKVRLVTRDDIFTMTVTDDGVGVDKRKSVRGIGLKNIGARVGFFGGSYEVQTGPGKGFVLQIRMPSNKKLNHYLPAQ